MKTKHLLTVSIIGFANYIAGLDAKSALTSLYQFNGKGNWSIDALGSTAPANLGDLDAIVPAGSTIQKAYLYSTTFGGSPTPTVNFDGTVYSNGQWTPLGFTESSSALQAFRTDVTSQVSAKVGGGGGLFSFSLDSENPSNVDGEMLVIVYSNPAEMERTIGLVDGFALSAGESTSINLASPLPDVTQLGFEAQLSLGIGFSYSGGGQGSQVDINGRRLTSAAGGFDDGQLANGALITGGGLGDNPLNPSDPFQGPSGNEVYDDELYDLSLGNSLNPAGFIAQGDTAIQVDTRNSSFDDNIFFLGINITAVAGINEPPPNNVPETGTTFALLGMGMLGLAGIRRRCKN
ncbi:MAG: VPDSG-CTERM sorting domain-containing protein [Verrucomicrobiaceae bacterium]|nr:MAG: VPDSG-CTERM sorting domain-containing protein [Verrucomicrobiaceae bacterium]